MRVVRDPGNQTRSLYDFLVEYNKGEDKPAKKVEYCLYRSAVVRRHFERTAKISTIGYTFSRMLTTISMSKFLIRVQSCKLLVQKYFNAYCRFFGIWLVVVQAEV